MTKARLLIQNSTGQFAMGLARDGALAFDSAALPALIGVKSPSAHFAALRAATGLAPADLGAIFVDIGPGGLGATRGSVAFANALGHGLGIPVCGVPAFALLGAHLEAETGKPVLCLRPAARPHFYVGLWEKGALELRFLPRPEVEELVAAHRQSHVFAGKFTLPDLEDAPEPRANTVPMQAFWAHIRGQTAPQSARAWPITEDLEIRHD